MLGMNQHHYLTNIKTQVMTLYLPGVRSCLIVADLLEVTQRSSQYHVLSLKSVFGNALRYCQQLRSMVWVIRGYL